MQRVWSALNIYKQFTIQLQNTLLDLLRADLLVGLVGLRLADSSSIATPEEAEVSIKTPMKRKCTDKYASHLQN